MEPVIQSPLRLFWRKNDSLHEGKSSGDNENMNKCARFKNKSAKYPGHGQQSCHYKKGKPHGTVFNLIIASQNLPFVVAAPWLVHDDKRKNDASRLFNPYQMPN